MKKSDVINDCAKAAHDEWFVEKWDRLKTLGLPMSWPSEAGEEQLVPWWQLSEPVREFDRIVVRAILDELERKGVVEFEVE